MCNVHQRVDKDAYGVQTKSTQQQESPSHPDPFRLFDVNAAARMLGVTPKTVYRRVEAGLMPHRRLFGHRSIRFTSEDIMGSLTRRASRAEILG